MERGFTINGGSMRRVRRDARATSSASEAAQHHEKDGNERSSVTPFQPSFCPAEALVEIGQGRQDGGGRESAPRHSPALLPETAAQLRVGEEALQLHCQLRRAADPNQKAATLILHLL